MKKEQIYTGYTLSVDLDGTMLAPIDKLKIVPGQARKFLRRFVLGGGRLIISTGRDLYFATQVQKILGVPADLNTANGAVIKLAKGEVIHNVYIKRNLLEELEQKVLELAPSTLFALKTTGKRTAMRLTDENRKTSAEALKMFRKYLGSRACHRGDYTSVAFDRALEYANGVFVHSFDREVMAKIAEVIDKDFAGRLKFCDGMIFEVVPFGEDKAKSLQTLVDYYKLDAKKLYVVGDDANDVASFEAVYDNSFCVKRSRNEEFCKAAKYTIERFWDVENYLLKAISK